jgi:hypothetical protein
VKKYSGITEPWICNGRELPGGCKRGIVSSANSSSMRWRGKGEDREEREERRRGREER